MLADENERRLVRGVFDFMRQSHDRNRHTGRFESEPGGEVDRFLDPVGRTQHHVDAVGDEVGIGVAQETVGREQIREIEIAFRARARPRGNWTAPRFLLNPRKPNFGAIHRKHHRLDVVVRGCIVQEHATRHLHLCARDFEGHGELGNTVVSDRYPRHSDIGELDDLLRQGLAEIVDDIGQRRAVVIPQVRKTPGKRDRGVARARFVRAGDNDPVASFDLGGG